MAESTGALGGGQDGPIEWFDRPTATSPLLICGFAGWNDAGNAASNAADHVEQLFNATPFASIDSEEFFDFTTTRPSIELTASGGRRIAWPTTTFSFAPNAIKGRDVIIAKGVEPQLKWRTFCDAVMGLAHDMQVSTLVSFGALLADVPHTRPTVVYSTSDGGSPLFDDLDRPTYEGPTGIIGVLLSACAVHGIPYASLWAAVPTYVPGASSPKAALALLKRLRDLFSFELNLEDLERDSQEYVRQVGDYVEEDPETLEFISELERHYDANHEASPEQLVAEVEQFLRQRGDI